MVGSVDECNVEDAKLRQSSDQTSLYDYEGDKEELFVGVVRYPDGDIRQVCNFNELRLAPTKDLLGDLIRERKKLQSKGMSYKKAHNEAFREVDYRRRYIKELPETTLSHFVQMVQGGENVVLVCYCSKGCRCHRHILKELIHERL